MKFLRITIFAALLVAGTSFSAMAQKDGKKPPKPPPPRVDPGGPDKKPKGNPPKGDNRPKKPGMSWFLFVKSESREERV